MKQGDALHAIFSATKNPHLVGLAAAITTVLVLYLREPGMIGNPQLWAEDAKIFYNGALQYGWGALAIPYAGYYHFLPRVMAALLVPVVPLQEIPLAFNISALMIAGAVAYLVATTRGPIPYKFAFAIVPALIPHGGEVFGTITNVQWFGGALLATFLVQPPALNARELARDIAVLFIFGLTGPFLVPLTPILMARWTLIRPGVHESLELLIAILIVAAIYAFALSRANFAASDLMSSFHNIQNFSASAIKVGVGEVFVSTSGTYGNVKRFIGLLFLLFIAASLLSAFRRTTWAFAALVIYGVVLLLMTRLKIDQPAFNNFNPTGSGQRYLFIPHIIVAWILIYTVVTNSNNAVRGAGLVFLLAAGFSAASSFHTPPLRDYQWKKQVKSVGTTPSEVMVPPNWPVMICRSPCNP